VVGDGFKTEVISLNRRRFLKYAGVTAAVVGASVLGVDYISKQSSSSVISTTSTTLKSEATTTRDSAESIKLASLQGRLFFDYNGNGKQDGEEPPVAGASVQLKDSTGKVIAEIVSDSSGDYKLEDVRTGAYKLHVEADKKFRNMCTSPSEFRAVAEDYAISLQGSTSSNIGLMEGFLTLPFDRNSPFEIGCYYDHKIGPGTESWMGTPQPVGDEHLATDFRTPENTKISATTPETVSRIWFREGEEGGFIVETVIKKIDDIEFNNSYAHLKNVNVEVGQLLKRGDDIGRSGNWGNYPHLHWSFLKFTRDSTGHAIPMAGERDVNVDPWAWTKGGNNNSYWTVFNDPQYPY